MTFRIGDQVRTPNRRGVGVIVRHHPTLPAWIVRFSSTEDRPNAYYDEMLEAA